MMNRLLRLNRMMDRPIRLIGGAYLITIGVKIGLWVMEGPVAFRRVSHHPDSGVVAIVDFASLGVGALVGAVTLISGLVIVISGLKRRSSTADEKASSDNL